MQSWWSSSCKYELVLTLWAGHQNNSKFLAAVSSSLYLIWNFTRAISKGSCYFMTLWKKLRQNFYWQERTSPFFVRPTKLSCTGRSTILNQNVFCWHLLSRVPSELQQLYDGCVQPLMFTVRSMLMSVMMIIDVDVDVDIDVYVVAGIYIDWFWWYLCLIITQQCLGPLCLW